MTRALKGFHCFPEFAEIATAQKFDDSFDFDQSKVGKLENS